MHNSAMARVAHGVARTLVATAAHRRLPRSL